MGRGKGGTLPPELGLNDKLALSQQLHSTVSFLYIYENLDFPVLNLFS